MKSSKKKPPSRILYSAPVLWLFGALVRVFTFVLFSTYKVQISGTAALTEAAKNKLIIALWHDRLLLAPLLRRVLKETPLAVVVSNSRDGKMLAAFVKTFHKATPIYVAHNVKHGALLQMIEALDRSEAILITPDGPRGPRHEVKPGLLYTQEKTGAQIIAMHWHASSSWTFKTWDRMQLPKPFARVELTFTLTTPENLQNDL